MTDFFIYKINNNGKEEKIVSFLTPDMVSKSNGLHPLSIWGAATMSKDGKSIQSMINNSVFVDFMHEIIQKHALEIPEVINAGKENNVDWVNIKDGREYENGDENSSIIGRFEVVNGEIQQDKYQKNTNYKLFNEKGLFSIHPYLERILYAEINKIIFGDKKLTTSDLNNSKLNVTLVDTDIDDEKIITFNSISHLDNIPEKFKIGKIKINIETKEILNFTANNEFVTFLHKTIKENATKNPEMILAGKSQKEGWIYIIDARTPTPQGDVPNEDIIGAFEVKNGTLIKDSYYQMDKHILLNSKGLFGLDDYTTKILINKINETTNSTDERNVNSGKSEKKQGFFNRLFKK